MKKSMSRPNQKPIYIPLDLQIDTLLRLPVKSLLRFRCVSKLWCSIITSQDFKKRHLNIASSSSPPRLLIAFQDFYGEKLLLVSSANPNVSSSSSSSSSCCVPYKDLSLFKTHGKLVYNAVRGWSLISVNKQKVGICNPSTRQLHIFPQLNDPLFHPHPKYLFGYDPVEDQYKVLGAINGLSRRLEHKVLVLGGERGWKEGPCVACPHEARTRALYMNGTLYYGATMTDIDYPNDIIIVSFDVRFETFSIIKVPSKFLPTLTDYKDFWNDKRYIGDKTLINYKGKIGVVENPRDGSFRMWVVEDIEKEEWSMNTFHLPQSAAGFDFKVMDTFSTGEICMVQKVLSDPFCLFYYNLKTNSMRSVTIEGLPMSELMQVVPRKLSVSVSDHYESLMLLET